MELDGISSNEIDSLLSEARNTAQQVSDEVVRTEMQSIMERLLDMKVALIEVQNLETKFGRGELTQDAYMVGRKKQVRDFIAAKDGIVQKSIPKIAARSRTEEEKNKFLGFKKFVSNNRDFFRMGAEFFLEVAKTFVKQ